VSATVDSPATTLAAELRRRLGPPPAATPDAATVSIIVVSHNGAEHLRTLLAGLIDRTDYPSLELIVVDNGSSDDSLEFLRSVPAPFPISIVANPHNESFSDANNQGAALATGGLLLFLNNDVEPFEEGWLRELVACLRSGPARAVGATLIFPAEDRERFAYGFAVQHRGLRFRDEGGTIGPALHGWESDPLDEELGKDVESPVVVAACLLVEAELFRRVGGFTHGYLYGSEDIDLCLKLRRAGTPILCSGRSLLIHRPGSTRRAVVFEEARDRKLRNHRFLLERWGPLLRREHDLAAQEGGGIWVQEGRGRAVSVTSREAEAVSICVRVGDDRQGVDASGDSAERLRRAALARGCRCLVLRGEEIDDLRGLECDVAVHIGGSQRYLPAPGQLNVLWEGGGSGDFPDAMDSRYDMRLGGDPDAVLAAVLAATERRA
jgi:GT2 family glycosyltransferase